MGTRAYSLHRRLYRSGGHVRPRKDSPASPASGTRGRASCRRGTRSAPPATPLPSFTGGSWAESASTSWSTCSRGMPLKSSTALPFWLRSQHLHAACPCPWGSAGPPPRSTARPAATFSGGSGLLEVGWRLRCSARRIWSTLHAENGCIGHMPLLVRHLDGRGARLLVVELQPRGLRVREQQRQARDAEAPRHRLAEVLRHRPVHLQRRHGQVRQLLAEVLRASL